MFISSWSLNHTARSRMQGGVGRTGIDTSPYPIRALSAYRKPHDYQPRTKLDHHRIPRLMRGSEDLPLPTNTTQSS